MVDIPVDSLVTRTLNVDFIYFDLMFLALWIFMLAKKRYYIPILWGLAGYLVYLFVDYYIWHLVMGSRTYEGTVPEGLFFQWFCFSAGFSQFSYVALMFEKRSWRDIWQGTAMFFLGWIAVGLLSQYIPWNDTILRVSRNMHANSQRLTFTIMAIANVLIGAGLSIAKKWRWEEFAYIMVVGTLVELNLELSLAVSGIRLEQGDWSWQLFITNTLIEFNMGVVLMYLLWLLVYRGRKRFFQPTLLVRDFRHIQTNFNQIYRFCAKQAEIPQNGDPAGHKSRILASKFPGKAYAKSKIAHDLEYVCRQYFPSQKLPEEINPLPTDL